MQVVTDNLTLMEIKRRGRSKGKGCAVKGALGEGTDRSPVFFSCPARALK